MLDEFVTGLSEDHRRMVFAQPEVARLVDSTS
jgi:hypothetical protein